MSAQPLTNNFFYPLEIIHSKKRATEQKKRINYYPFGLKMKGFNDVVNGVDHKYGFGGKEEQNDNIAGNNLEWLDFGARNYDATLGRWMNIDPLAEKMRRHSPYNYAFNNPVYWIDPDGMEPQESIDPVVEKKSSSVTTYTAVSGRKGVHEYKTVSTESTVTTNYTKDSEGNNVINKSTESRTTTNTLRFRAVVDDEGNNGVNMESSTQTVESSITESTVTVRDNDMGGGSASSKTVATNLDGKDGTTNISVKSQPMSIKNPANAAISQIKRNLDYVPIKHALPTLFAVPLSGVVGILSTRVLGWKGPAIMIAANAKRAYDSESNFNGTRVVIESNSSTRRVKK